MEKLLFEIPVYRISFKKHSKDTEDDFEKFLAVSRGRSVWEEDDIKRKRGQFEKYRWRPWRYNEIIAWICLKVDIKKISAEVYQLDSKRLGKDLKNRTFRYCYPSEVGQIYDSMDSDMIAKELIKAVDRAVEPWIRKKP